MNDLKMSKHTWRCSWQSVNAAFIFNSVVSVDGGLYISCRGNIWISETTPRFQAGDFQKLFPPGPAFALASQQLDCQQAGVRLLCG